MPRSYDPAIEARVEELAGDLGGSTNEELQEGLQRFLSEKPSSHLSKSNESLLIEFEASGWGIDHE